jgi:hypothetical protein
MVAETAAKHLGVEQFYFTVAFSLSFQLPVAKCGLKLLNGKF